MKYKCFLIKRVPLVDSYLNNEILWLFRYIQMTTDYHDYTDYTDCTDTQQNGLFK